VEKKYLACVTHHMSLNSLASLKPWSRALVLSAALDTTRSQRCCTDTSRFLMRITSCFWLKYFRWVPFLSSSSMVSRWVATSFWNDLCSSIWTVNEWCREFVDFVSPESNNKRVVARIAEVKQRWSVIGWVTKNLLSRAPPCFGRHVKPLVPVNLQSLAHTNPHWAHVVGYGPFSLCVIHKEGLCPSNGDINRLMMVFKLLPLSSRMNIFYLGQF
jgi:hypothetical protein